MVNLTENKQSSVGHKPKSKQKIPTYEKEEHQSKKIDMPHSSKM